MSELRARFLANLPEPRNGVARILDAGSGSGRDARSFRLAGYRVEAFDAAPAMVAATRDHAGVPTWQRKFEDFSWDHPFEGIWACASLLHVARADLFGVFGRLAAHLVPGGVLHASFKFGTIERVKGGRRFTDMTEDSLSALLEPCPDLWPLHLWRSEDVRPDRASEQWLNALLRKT